MRFRPLPGGQSHQSGFGPSFPSLLRARALVALGDNIGGDGGGSGDAVDGRRQAPAAPAAVRTTAGLFKVG